ncbi:MAG: ABC transporter permease [Planctomycetota bacterium]
MTQQKPLTPDPQIKPANPSWWLQFVSTPLAKCLFALAMILLIGCLFNADGSFFKFGTHRDTLRQSAVYGILATGMTLVILTGGIDLSVGSVLALAAVTGSMASIHWGWPGYIVFPLVILVGASAGFVSGGLVAWLKVQPFIATLAMMVFARGLAKWVTGGAKVSTAVPQADGSFEYVDVPELFRLIDSRWLYDSVSVVSLIFIVCWLFAAIVLWRHRWGRELYAIGGNVEAARLSGIPVARSTIWAYVVCGGMAGLAGLCQAAQEQQGDSDVGVTYELVAIAMVVIGGTNLMGGRGGLGLTLIGILSIGYLEKILSINAVPEAGRLMLTATIIIVAVLAQRSKTI